MKFREWLLKEEDAMGGAPPGGAAPPPGGDPMGGGMPPPPMGGGGPPPMGGDPMGGGMGGAPGGGGPITQSQLTKMKSISAWDAIAEVLGIADKNKSGEKKGDLVEKPSGPKHLMQ